MVSISHTTKERQIELCFCYCASFITLKQHLEHILPFYDLHFLGFVPDKPGLTRSGSKIRVNEGVLWKVGIKLDDSKKGKFGQLHSGESWGGVKNCKFPPEEKLCLLAGSELGNLVFDDGFLDASCNLRINLSVISL